MIPSSACPSPRCEGGREGVEAPRAGFEPATLRVAAAFSDPRIGGSNSASDARHAPQGIGAPRNQPIDIERSSTIMGPIQVFLLGFEDFQATGGIAAELATLSDAGTIRVIDARLLLKDSADSVTAMRASDLGETEREDLRAAAGALIGMGAGAVLEGEEGAAAGLVLGADAALAVGEIGLSEAEIGELAAELDVGEALLLLVIENVWAAGLAGALREAGIVFAQQDYLTPEGLVALGAMLGLEVALDS